MAACGHCAHNKSIKKAPGLAVLLKYCIKECRKLLFLVRRLLGADVDTESVINIAL